MLSFFIGLWVGGIVGVFSMCLFIVSGGEARREEQMQLQSEEHKKSPPV